MKKRENEVYDLRDFEPIGEETTPLKVLVVDDNEVLTLLVSKLMEGLGCKSDIAYNGLDASFELLQKDFDLLVIDWDMPLRNGKWTLEQVDKWVGVSEGYINPNLRFVLYTGTDPETIDLPHTPNLKFVDFWCKKDGVDVLQKKAKNLIRRLNKEVA